MVYLLLFVGTVLWFAGLAPFWRVLAYLGKHRPIVNDPFGEMGKMLREAFHPMHRDMQMVAYTYGGFILAVVLVALIGGPPR